jgi:hypothetical protein
MKTILMKKQDIEEVIDRLLKTKSAVGGVGDCFYMLSENEEFKGIGQAKDEIYNILKILKKYINPHKSKL